MLEGVGNRDQEGEKEGDWGERVRAPAITTPLLFIAADAGVRKFLTG